MRVCVIQIEFIYCYLYVVMLLKSLHCSTGQSVMLPSSLDVSQPLVQRMATTPCSDVHTDDGIDDADSAASREC